MSDSLGRLFSLLGDLPSRHVMALNWFRFHANQDVPWPKPLPDGTLVLTRAKGIYKPAWSKYALGICQWPNSRYPDKEVEVRRDGSWKFEYFQEDLDPTRRDSAFTNVGLIECYKDAIPVGVAVQIKPKPRPLFHIHGLALVTGWDQGYFVFEGLTSKAHSDTGADAPVGLYIAGSSHAALPTERADAAAAFDPSLVTDERERVLAEVARRRGQKGFRDTLLSAYGHRCAITGYDAPSSLEAAHISPYRGPATNHPSNGIILRADLHTLFDVGHLAVSPDDHRVLIASDLRGTAYEKSLCNAVLRSPTGEYARPSQGALKAHIQWAMGRNQFD